jgi:hypothetical protein
MTCASCHTTLNVKDSFAGKRGKCPKCGAVMDIPAAAPAPAIPTADAGTPLAQQATAPKPVPAAGDLSAMAPAQMVNVFVERGEGAILILFSMAHVNFEDLTDLEVDTFISENLSETDMQAIVLKIAERWRATHGGVRTNF